MKSAISVLAVVLLPWAALSADKFKITTKKADDAVETRTEKDRTVFTVKCPSGIGGATIERIEENWPDAVLLRLHLSGLESFSVSNGKVAIGAAVSSHDGSVRIEHNKEKAPLDMKSPSWMSVHMIDADGKPVKQVPLKNGSIEISLPRALFKDNPKTIVLTWIDFYRN